MEQKWTGYLTNLLNQLFKAIFFILQIIGRLTYKSFFHFIYLNYLLLSLIFVSIKKIYKETTSFFKNTKTFIRSIEKRIKEIKFPKIKKPNLKIPKLEVVLPKINIPKLQLPKLKITFLKLNILIILFLSAFGSFFYFYILKGLPNPQRLSTRKQILSTKIYDRNNKLLYTVFDGNHNRSLVKLEDIPQDVINATITIEDNNFYNHPGFSPRAIVRAAWNNSHEKDHLQGGSTITQQLVKNAFLSPEQTFKRKIKELVLSIQVDLLYNKDEILEMYFNEVPYGGTAYGIEEAAQLYLDKSITDVNLAEAALLAGLPAAPTHFSPFGANPQLAAVRQRTVLNKMLEHKYITRQEYENAKKQKIKLASQRSDIKAPHFVMYVKDQLVKKYGQRMVEQGGLKVTTSLDLDVQEFAQAVVASEVAKLKQMNVSNGASIVTNPKTGEILAMVGSRNYFDKQIDGNVNLTTSQRQPGSAIKPVNYAVALENGFNPATRISDTPITYHIPGSEPYSPVNYDHKFHGPVSLRTALGSSYNVPAVKTLSIFGVDKMIDMGEKMGITTWKDRSRFGLSLTLGGGEVKMTDMAVVYGTLANQGKKIDLHPILEVKNNQGKTLEKTNIMNLEKKSVLDPGVAYLLNNILSDNQARSPAFGPSSYLVIPKHEVAVKTGTTNDKRDNWTIGYTENALVAVWVGNNDNSPMSAVASGVTGASPIWHKTIKKLLKETPSHQFTVPNNVKKIKVCAYNGLLPCEGCPTINEYYLEQNIPKYHCSSEKIKEAKKENPILEGISTRR